MNTALVTGANGFIGSWLARALVDRGVRVIALERDRPAPSGLQLTGIAEAVTLARGGVQDPGVVERVIAEYGVDTVFHLAAQTIVGTAGRSPVATFEANVAGTWTLMEACRAQQVERVVVASSDKAYGSHAQLPYRESMALQPRFPYDVSKAATDLIARSYWHAYGVPVAVTRLANVYGGGDRNFSRLIPEAVCAALDGRRPVVRSDGSPERDFLHVDDAVAAYLTIAEALDHKAVRTVGPSPDRTEKETAGQTDANARPDGARGEAFNAGGGTPHAVRDVITHVLDAAGSSLTPDIRGAGTPSGEIDRQWVDATKLTALTGWSPQIGLAEGIERTVAWYRDHPHVRPHRAGFSG